MTKTLPATLLLALCCGGCNIIAYVGYIFAPGPKSTTVEAEYPLKDAKVAIVVYADKATLFDYPLARLEVSAAVDHQMRQCLSKVTTVDSSQVIRYQDETLDWESIDRTQLGKALGADYVLFVSLVEYSTHEMAGTDLYRGRIAAEASLYRTELPEGQARVWNDSELRVTYPAEGVTGQLASNDEQIRYATHTALAQMLVKRFYTHKEVQQ